MSDLIDRWTREVGYTFWMKTITLCCRKTLMTKEKKAVAVELLFFVLRLLGEEFSRHFIII